MLEILRSPDGCRAFAEELQRDAAFSDPLLATERQLEHKLLDSFSRRDHTVLGAYSGGALSGLFVFLILDGEKYIEMLAGLSREAAVWAEAVRWLQTRYVGYQADFVFNPSNFLLRALLQEKGAAFNAEQMKMTLSDTSAAAAVDTRGVEPLSEKTMAQYLAIHSRDAYWTGEKVAAAPERFRALVALDGETVVGYIDVTNCFDENEPYHLFVQPAYRRRGRGRALLAKAIELNRPNAMMLQVDVDNIPAIRLYEGLGFTPVPGQNSVTAHWRIE